MDNRGAQNPNDKTLPWEKEDRPPALLTTEQRKLLLNGYDLSKAKDRAKMSRVRKRIREAMKDFTLLHERIGVSEIRKTFAETETAEAPELGEYYPVEGGFVDALSFVYLAQNNTSTKNGDDEGWKFAHIAKHAIERALHKRGVVVRDVNVSVVTDTGPEFESLSSEDLSDLNREELLSMLKARQITEREYGVEIAKRESEEIGDNR